MTAYFFDNSSMQKRILKFLTPPPPPPQEKKINEIPSPFMTYVFYNASAHCRYTTACVDWQQFPVLFQQQLYFDGTILLLYQIIQPVNNKSKLYGMIGYHRDHIEPVRNALKFLCDCL